ncbi:S9 family peptidase [Nocardioides sp. CFH 31398]|uniref:S9 family peptidase n=1 Tax=Nocardioides sp. CFH 31398 TaxID=2919579 RepID=UPI001F067805|nr:S9 family peptidase [Nocardioides sp. CFH 31398]MCH1868335.1 S9 family peptidase [Nocardioides sp. CFH 31398]
MDAATPTSPPTVAKKPVETTHHGRTRVDDHDWLRDKEDPEVLAYLEAENAWTQASTAHLADLRQTLFDEIKARTRETDLSVPTRRRGHWYYSRSFEGREYGATCRVPVSDPEDWAPPRPAEDCAPEAPALPGEEVMLDLDALAEGHDFFSLGGASVSPDDRLLAYAVDVVGDERYTVRFRALVPPDGAEPAGAPNDVLTDVMGGVTWDRDGDNVYYTTVDESWRPDKVWRHRLGTAQSDDELVHHETDARFWTGIGRTRNDRFLMIATGSKTTAEWRVLDADRPELGFRVFAERREGLEYSLEHAVLDGRDVLLVLHDHTGPDHELGVAPIDPTPAEEWEPLLPHDPAVRLEDVDAFASHLVVHQRSGGLTQLRVLELGETGEGLPAGVARDHLVDFEREIRTVGSGSNPAWEQPTVRVGLLSLALPTSIYDYDLRTDELTLLRRQPVLGGYDPDDYAERRLWATSTGGERVPISVVCRRDLLGPDGEHPAEPLPLLLYGYGAYEISMDPSFSVSRLSLLDRGAAFAIAHVRGGGEMGRRWYDDGKLGAKQHTFDDFVACARHLVDAGWTTPERTVAEGGSAGGLLMGAVANQAPEQFGGVVAAVPFVDPLTSMLDASLPLTVTEYEEWGDPASGPEVYDRIAAYAPYDNVAALDYPPILAETSLHDTRVLYVEPAKWVARLRDRAVGRREVLLRTEMSAGHGGVSGRYRAWHDRAFSLAWILDRLGLAG